MTPKYKLRVRDRQLAAANRRAAELEAAASRGLRDLERRVDQLLAVLPDTHIVKPAPHIKSDHPYLRVAHAPRVGLADGLENRLVYKVQTLEQLVEGAEFDALFHTLHAWVHGPGGRATYMIAPDPGPSGLGVEAIVDRVVEETAALHRAAIKRALFPQTHSGARRL